ncbi:MAG TPA: MBOAT family O-acyltransferase [Stellaceae bacterium]|nr:MBOAT family O-acyltransferase [Stellaceae bacterium]
MTVPSVEFLVFAAFAAMLFHASKAKAWRLGVLVGANLLFLMSFSTTPTDFVPFVGFLLLGHVGMRAAQSSRSLFGFIALVVTVVAVFCWLKQYAFIPKSAFLDFPYLTIGISYIFFRVMHLIIDARQGSLPARVGPLSYLAYTLNFTSLVSGPIQRYQDFDRTQSANDLPLDNAAVGRALERIVVGFFKVAVVSAALFALHNTSVHTLSADQPFLTRIATGVTVATVFPLYLYFNFSGYTDFVIGVARFFSIRLPENFDRPFSSENFINFWSRWHITLSAWLRTYVYNPLLMALMSRFPAARLQRFFGVSAFFVTFFLVGVWHGQTSEFLMFGLLQGLGVSLNKLYQIEMAEAIGRARYRNLCMAPMYRAFCRGLTFTWFSLTLFFFWSSWDQMSQFVDALGLPTVIVLWIVTTATATITLAAYEGARNRLLRLAWDRRPLLLHCARTALDTCAAILILLTNVSPSDLVYKGF